MVACYRKWRKVMDRFVMYCKYYCVIIMLVMLFLAFVQVVRRYAFNNPWSWSDEVILLMLAWFAYPSICFNVWTDDHFHISALYCKMPVKIQIVLDVFRHLVIGAFTGLLGYYGYLLMLQYASKPYPMTGISQGLRFFPVLFGGILSAVFCISNLIGTFIDRPLQEGQKEAGERGKGV